MKLTAELRKELGLDKYPDEDIPVRVVITALHNARAKVREEAGGLLGRLWSALRRRREANGH
jgi:hypothetical protein